MTHKTTHLDSKAVRALAASLCILGVAATSQAAAATRQTAADTITAQDAFVKMPAKTLDLLTTSMRMDMLDYYNKRDSIYEVVNAMEGLSHLVRPVTEEWLQAQVTPVSKLTVRVLPYKAKWVVMSIYTIGDSLQAADSEIRFYDTAMQELNADKFIKTLSSKDFFNFDGLKRKERDELLELVPFPTVEYFCGPDENELHARLTVGEFLGKETLDKITPYLRRERTFTWDGNKFRLAP